MMRTLSTWLILAVGAAALMAACGGKSTTTSSTGGSSSTPSTASTTSTASPPPGIVSTGASGAGAPARQRVSGQRAVATCKSAIQAQTSIPASAKAKLEGICGKADKESAEAVAHEECLALVNATPLPNGVAKQRALALCKAPG